MLSGHTDTRFSSAVAAGATCSFEEWIHAPDMLNVSFSILSFFFSSAKWYPCSPDATSKWNQMLIYSNVYRANFQRNQGTFQRGVLLLVPND